MVHNPASEQNYMLIAMRASRIISQLKRTSVYVILLIGLCGLLLHNIGAYDRTVIEGQLREQYKVALYEGGIPPRMVPEFASMWANSTITDVESSPFGDIIVRYFVWWILVQMMIMSTFVNTVNCGSLSASLQGTGLLLTYLVSRVPVCFCHSHPVPAPQIRFTIMLLYKFLYTYVF